MSIMINPYRDEYMEIISNYSDKYSHEYVYNILGNMWECKPLPDDFYKDKHETKTVNTINGIRRIPYILAITIMFNREEDLTQLMTKTLMNVSQDIYSFKFKKHYEPEAIKIRDKYNRIINYYAEEYTNKTKK